ncbi:MAG TPA: 4-alpha-glucanotransferase [Candidatus Bathyarchaeia archaeon]|nr:4-alpha-glucanotransferase [Candidatus Bathyarchaeia archaeon]
MNRCSGILLHVTSLPSRHAIGDLGIGAHAFADFLARAGQTVWQVLPLSPTDGAHGNSPYSSVSAFAGNALLISPEILVDEGLLRPEEVPPPARPPAARVDYREAAAEKWRLLGRAYERFRSTGWKRDEYERFCSNAPWLEDYALFVVLKKHFAGVLWSAWPREFRDRDEMSLADARSMFSLDIDRTKFFQFLFFRQWMALKARCAGLGVRLMGDIPIYVNYDSVDVWTNNRFFKLGPDRRPLFLAGVPPDYFSETGQLWGNPVYDWGALRADGYRWWIARFAHNLGLFDHVRVDHFRGFVAYWQVPAGEKTAVKGAWVKAPADDFFGALLRAFPGFPLIAEDLGIITPDVKEVMARHGIPGMRVLLFAFTEDNPKHPYLPVNYVKNCVVYTGTHDNNTARGWFAHEALPEERARLERCVGRKVTEETVHVELIRLAMTSVADVAVIPMQDILGLGEEARMNRPAVPQGNWEWRLLASQITPALADGLAAMTEGCGRAPHRPAAGDAA